MMAYMPVPGFPRYIATRSGEIYSIGCWVTTGQKARQYRPGRLLSPVRKGGRYLAVSLSTGKGRAVQRLVHDVVLAAWCGPKPKSRQVRHLDGNWDNNALDNLAYGTALENKRDQYRHGTAPVGLRHWAARLTEDNIREIRKSPPRKNKVLAKKFGVHPEHIGAIRARRSWKHVE